MEHAMSYICENPWSLLPAVALGGFLWLVSLIFAISRGGELRGGRVRLKISEISLDAPVFVTLLLAGGVLFLYPVYVLKQCQQPGADVTSIENNFNNITIYEQLGRDYKTREFWITREPGHDVVYGDSGTFYLIDLRDRQADASIYFDPGKYNKDRLSQAYREALDSLKAKVLHPLDSLTVPYRLYVVGTADTLDAEDPLLGAVLGDLPDRITFLEKNPGRPGQWLLDARDAPTPREYDNDDLPNLRGAFLQQLVKGMNCDVTLLEGSVIESNNPMDRRALLYLYWPGDHAAPQRGDDRPACR
jgi:hypothetical protein